jgi:uncharacterized protein YkwD
MDVNQLEMDIQAEINRIRANPTVVVPELTEYVKHFKGKYYKIPETNINVVTNEGAEAVIDAIEWLKTLSPTAPLQEAKGLYHAARDHAVDLGGSGKTSHVGSNNSRMNERIERYGDWDHSLAENIAFDDANARDIVIGMLIDDGNKSRGQRRNMLNPEFKFFGVAVAKHAKHKWVTIINFAVHFQDHPSGISGQPGVDTFRKKTTIVHDAQTKGSPDLGEQVSQTENGARMTKADIKARASAFPTPGPIDTEGAKLPFKEPKGKVVVQGLPDSLQYNDSAEKRSLSPNNRGRPQFDERLYAFENDPDRPTGAVSVKIKRHIKVKGNRRMIKLTKIYTMQQGDPEIIEIIDFESL